MQDDASAGGPHRTRGRPCRLDGPGDPHAGRRRASRSGEIAPQTRVVRYERERPGELVHVDVKKLAGIPEGGGWRLHGRGDRGQNGNGTAGYRYLHSAIDDRTRLIYSEILNDEQALTAAAFWGRATAFFSDHGISVERVITDNGSCYRSGHWHLACAATGTTVKKTRPRRPQTNGKIERFHRILLEEWAYIRAWTSEAERAAGYTHVLPLLQSPSIPRQPRLGDSYDDPRPSRRGQRPRLAHLVGGGESTDREAISPDTTSLAGDVYEVFEEQSGDSLPRLGTKERVVDPGDGVEVDETRSGESAHRPVCTPFELARLEIAADEKQPHAVVGKSLPHPTAGLRENTEASEQPPSRSRDATVSEIDESAIAEQNLDPPIVGLSSESTPVRATVRREFWWIEVEDRVERGRHRVSPGFLFRGRGRRRSRVPRASTTRVVRERAAPTRSARRPGWSSASGDRRRANAGRDGSRCRRDR